LSLFGFCFGDANVMSFIANTDLWKKTTSGNEGFAPERRIGREPMPFSLATVVSLALPPLGVGRALATDERTTLARVFEV
jgi:hypothetical protein